MQSVRPSLLKRSAPLIVLGSAIAFFFGGTRLWHACAARDAERRAAMARAADERDLAIAAQIHARFAPLAHAVGEPAMTCPPDLRGPLDLVEADWFDWFVAHGAPDTAPRSPFMLRSPSFGYLTDVLLPDDEAQFDRRNAALKQLLAAKYIAIATVVETPMVTTGNTFSGGTVDGTIAIGDAAGHVVCATHVSSAPTFVIAVGSGMLNYESMRAVRMDFWTAAQEAVAHIAPGATLVHE